MSHKTNDELTDRDYDLLVEYYYSKWAETNDEDEKCENWILGLTMKQREQFLKEQKEENKFQEAECKDCLDSGYIVQAVHDEHGGEVDYFKKKCHCNYE